MTQERLDFVPRADEVDGVPAARIGWWGNLQTHRKAWLAIRGIREIILIAGTYSLYDVTRYLVAGDHDAAFAHARSILHFEQRLHLDPEHWLNNLFTDHIALGLPADYIYATLHYIVTPVVLIWLWRRHPSSYASARTVLICTTVIGLAVFSLVPVAPPRLLSGFMDTMAHFSKYGWWSNAGSAPRGLGADTNQYAAMPSLHVGWALWSGWQLVRHGQHRVTRWLGAFYPLLLAVVVMGTGNHYLMDVFAGVAVVVVGAAVAYLFGLMGRQLWPNHHPNHLSGAGGSAPASALTAPPTASPPTA